MNPRAWASLFALCAFLGLALVIALRPRPDTPDTQPACRAMAPAPATPLACLQGLSPTILSAELAGRGEAWACQLARGTPEVQPSLTALTCAEDRSRSLRAEVTGFDQGLFIPLYGALSALLVAWAWSRARLSLSDAPARDRARAWGLGLSCALLVALDLRENAHVLGMLGLLDQHGAALAAGAATAPLSALDAAAQSAREASAHKWLASALWAGALSAALAGVLRWAPSQAAPRPWRWLVRLAWLGAAAASLAFVVGATAALAGSALPLPVRWLAAGMACALLAMTFAGVAAAWGALKSGIAYTAEAPMQPPPH